MEITTIAFIIGLKYIEKTQTSNISTFQAGPPGIPVLKMDNSPPPAYHKIPVIEKRSKNIFRGTITHF